MTIFTQSRLLSKVLSVFSLLLLLTSNLTAQFCLGLNVQPDEANSDELFLELTSDEFIGVAAMQFSIAYDPNVVEPIKLVSSNLEGFGNGNFNFDTELSGLMALAWFDPQAAGVTILEEEPLLVFKFKKIKEGDPSFDFAEHPTVVAITICQSGGGLNCNEFDNFVNCNTGENQIPTVSGRLYVDENKNCEIDEEESVNTLQSWRGWKIAASQNGIYKFSGFLEDDGSYSLKTFPGENLIEIIPPGPYYSVCEPSFTIATDETTTDPPFFENSIQILRECPLLEVDLASIRVEPCQDGLYFLSYANNGTIDVKDAYIDLSMDARLSIEDIDAASSDLGNNNFKINLGDLPIGTSDFILIRTKVPCDILPEETFRNEAIILPPNSCGEIENTWSGASIIVDGRCEGDQIIFEFENIGNADMVEPSQYVVIEDAIIFRTQNVQLASGGRQTVTVPANGAAYFIQAEQEVGHPGTYLPSAFVEACGRNETGTFSTGFANRFPEENNDLAVSVDYQSLINSQESIRLSTSPIGFQDEHYIEPNKVIEYTIHFDNSTTGVQIVDEFSPFLDVTTFSAVSSNSAFDYTLEEGILTLDIFPAVPNGALNQDSYVKFSIKPIADLPLGTVISNKATLNYSEERIEETNTVFHTLEQDFIQTSTSTTSTPVFDTGISIYPNPSTDVIMFTIKDWQPIDYQLSIFDVDGKKLQTHKFNNKQYRFQKGDLPTGTYLYRLIGANGMITNGFFVLID